MVMISDFYNKIFDPIFLIKYGFYDFEVKKIKNINEDYIQYGPSNTFYGKVFNMDSVAKYLEKNYQKINEQMKEKGEDTEPISFSIPKSESGRREYKIPNLYSYISLVIFLHKSKEEFIDKFKENTCSISKYFNMEDFNYATTDKIRMRLLYGATRRLHIDFANFFHTLYTHSIPWIIEGKEKSKKERTGGFSNELDRLLRSCQYGETHGIPTGNLASRIIAELYMCYFDEKIFEKLGKEIAYVRYVDDIYFGYNLDSEKEKFLAEINLLCRTFNLILNDKKTSIENHPFNNIRDKSAIFSWLKNKQPNSVNDLITELIRLSIFCESQESIGNKGAIKALYTVIGNWMKSNYKRKGLGDKAKIVNFAFSKRDSLTQFNLFEYFLNLSLLDPVLTNRFLNFFEVLIELGFPEKCGKKIVQEYFESHKIKYQERFKYYLENHLSEEGYQLLLYFVVFDIRGIFECSELLNAIRPDVDDFTLVLITILYRKNKGELCEILKKIDELLKITHENYAENHTRMKEKLWFYRYFIYYLIDNDQEVNKKYIEYCDKNGYADLDNDNYEYKTELNWKYIIKQEADSHINQFYQELLDNKVTMVSMGKNNKFDYI